MKKITALFLAVIMIFSLSSQALAVSEESEKATTIILTEELGIQTGGGMSESEIREAANKIFDYLTPEQQ